MEKLFKFADGYDFMLNQGLQVSGETKEYFIHGRIKDLLQALPEDLKVSRILDYGCGTGETSVLLKHYFSNAEIIGVDLSNDAVKYAQNKYSCTFVKFDYLNKIPLNYFDLVYVNGVFHHIKPQHRINAIKTIYNCLKPQGVFALFENNPWNFGTKIVMKKIKFDRDAKIFNSIKAKNIIKSAGFEEIYDTRYLFYFPKALSVFRFIEKYMIKLPLGAQYYIIARKK